MFLYRLPCLPSANKTGLGHMLTRDQSFPGHGYGFYPSESRTIYIYIALQQHDVQMIQHWPTHRFIEVWVLHHYVQPAQRATQLHFSSLWLQLISGVVKPWVVLMACSSAPPLKQVMYCSKCYFSIWGSGSKWALFLSEAFSWHQIEASIRRALVFEFDTIPSL